MKNWFIKHREVLAYLVFGVLTTLLNIVLYALFSRLFGYEAANSWGNVLDNVICILFAYVTNRAFVFASRTQGREALKEFGAFVTCRLGTLVLDAAIMMIFGNLLAAQGAALVESFMDGALSLLAGWFGPDTVLHMATGGAAPPPSPTALPPLPSLAVPTVRRPSLSPASTMPRRFGVSPSRSSPTWWWSC